MEGNNITFRNWTRRKWADSSQVVGTDKDKLSGQTITRTWESAASSAAIYVNPVNGSDSNTGLSQNVPVLTMDKAYELCEATGRSIITLVRGTTQPFTHPEIGYFPPIKGSKKFHAEGSFRYNDTVTHIGIQQDAGTALSERELLVKDTLINARVIDYSSEAQLSANVVGNTAIYPYAYFRGDDTKLYKVHLFDGDAVPEEASGETGRWINLWVYPGDFIISELASGGGVMEYLEGLSEDTINFGTTSARTRVSPPVIPNASAAWCCVQDTSDDLQFYMYMVSTSTPPTQVGSTKTFTETMTAFAVIGGSLFVTTASHKLHRAFLTLDSTGATEITDFEDITPLDMTSIFLDALAFDYGSREVLVIGNKTWKLHADGTVTAYSDNAINGHHTSDEGIYVTYRTSLSAERTTKYLPLKDITLLDTQPENIALLYGSSAPLNKIAAIRPVPIKGFLVGYQKERRRVVMLDQAAFSVEAPIAKIPPSYRLLVHSDHPDGNTTFADHSPSGLTITPYGATEHSDDQSKFGLSSVLVPSGGGLNVTGTLGNLDVVSSDFTVAFWVYPPSGMSATLFYMVSSATTAAAAMLDISHLTNGRLQFALLGGQRQFTGTWVYDDWNYVVVRREGTGARAFINGVELSVAFSSGNMSGLILDTTAFKIGRRANDSNVAVGCYFEETLFRTGLLSGTNVPKTFFPFSGSDDSVPYGITLSGIRFRRTFSEICVINRVNGEHVNIVNCALEGFHRGAVSDEFDIKNSKISDANHAIDNTVDRHVVDTGYEDSVRTLTLDRILFESIYNTLTYRTAKTGTTKEWRRLTFDGFGGFDINTPFTLGTQEFIVANPFNETYGQVVGTPYANWSNFFWDAPISVSGRLTEPSVNKVNERALFRADDDKRLRADYLNYLIVNTEQFNYGCYPLSFTDSPDFEGYTIVLPKPDNVRYSHGFVVSNVENTIQGTVFKDVSGAYLDIELSWNNTFDYSDILKLLKLVESVNWIECELYEPFEVVKQSDTVLESDTDIPKEYLNHLVKKSDGTSSTLYKIRDIVGNTAHLTSVSLLEVFVTPDWVQQTRFVSDVEPRETPANPERDLRGFPCIVQSVTVNGSTIYGVGSPTYSPNSILLRVITTLKRL